MIANSIHEALYKLLNNIVANKMSYLNALGIKEFGYRRFSNDRTIGFCSQRKWNQFVIEYDFSKEMADHYSKELSNIVSNELKYCVRTGVRNPDSKFLEALYNHELWNTLVVYKHSHDKIEGFYFVASLENNAIIDLYLNKLALFDNFASMIQKPINDIISERKWEELAIEFNGLEILHSTLNGASSGLSVNSQDHRLDDIRPQLLSSIKVDNSPNLEQTFNISKQSTNIFKPKGVIQITSLTPQEINHVTLVALGHSNKQISDKLNISPRTAEKRISYIKNKLGVYSKSQLVDLFYQSQLYKLIKGLKD